MMAGEPGSSADDGVDTAWRDTRERRRHARDQGRVEADQRADRQVVTGVPLADVARLGRRESLTRVMQDGFADTGTLKPARRDRS